MTPARDRLYRRCREDAMLDRPLAEIIAARCRRRGETDPSR
ncbi:MAG: hypothetical protein U1E53_34425 [Dongiaceae bacterium]